MIKNIIILLLILGFIAIVVFLDLPKTQGVLDLIKQIKEQKRIFLEEQDLLAKIKELDQQYEENKENLKKIDYILPSSQDLPNLIVQLEALALESGLVLDKIEFSEAEQETSGKAKEVRQSEEKVTPKDYRIISVSLTFIGDYLLFKNFLKTVEENMRLIDVVAVDFGKESSETTQLFNFNLSLKTYYK